MEQLTYFEALEKLDKPNQWLEYYHSFFGEFWTQKQGKNNKTKEPFFSKWEQFTPFGGNYDVNNRLIFQIEIVIDTDCGNKKRAEITTEHIVNKLTRLGFNFSVWYSGGIGSHIHIFFPELGKHKIEDVEYLKREFLKWIEIDRGYVDLATVYSKHLISLECSKHRKGGKKTLISYVHQSDMNVIPRRVLERALCSKQKENNMSFVEDIPYSDKSKMECIKFIESGAVSLKVKDFYRRAAFIYGALLKGKHNDEYIIKRLMKYLKMRENVAKDIVKYLKKDRCMTCQGRRRLLKDANLDKLCDGCKFNVTK